MRKDLGWEGSSTSAWYSLGARKLYVAATGPLPEAATTYYTSRTGLSGAGFVNLVVDDTIPVMVIKENDRQTAGSFRPGTNEKKMCVFGTHISFEGWQSVERTIWVTAEGPDHSLVIHQIYEHGVTDLLASWETTIANSLPVDLKVFHPENGREVQLRYFSPKGAERRNRETEEWEPRPTRYPSWIVSLFHPQASEELAWQVDKSIHPCLNKRLRVGRVGDDWYRLDRCRLATRKLASDPWAVEMGDESVSIGVGGWFKFAPGCFAVRPSEGEKVFALIELPRAEFGRLNIAGLPEWIEYEAEYSVYDFFQRGYASIAAELRKSLLAKARKDAQYRISAIRRERGNEERQLSYRELMLANPATRVCIADSIATGNCRVGTEQFIAQFGVRQNAEGCTTLGELINNPRIEEMIGNYQFIKVLDHVLTKHGVTTTAPEVPDEFSDLESEAGRSPVISGDEFVEVMDE